jgi:cytochrome c5
VRAGRGRIRVATAAAALAVAVAARVRAEAPALPDGPGKVVLERACSQCHSLETVVRFRGSRAQWEAKIDTMIARGAKLSDDEIDVIAAYLAEHFPRAASD